MREILLNTLLTVKVNELTNPLTQKHVRSQIDGVKQ